MASRGSWLLAATLFISMAFLTLASRTLINPSLHEEAKMEAPAMDNRVGMEDRTVNKSTVEESKRQVPTGSNPVHHNRDPFHHFL
ncbi:uncharacterized protein A4U43_C01F33380 [Asparagus officinalis]|uniref:Uncharacterized protein n=1 Tax=Asparagus officinalis TaxID=4686 RepID=A0A5P1FW77_ASPOF|nr:uncharacterized protein A4U43_C01F33380 [Asparagus officinalis]